MRIPKWLTDPKRQFFSFRTAVAAAWSTGSTAAAKMALPAAVVERSLFGPAGKTYSSPQHQPSAHHPARAEHGCQPARRAAEPR